jgi:hypothetical protein
VYSLASGFQIIFNKLSQNFESAKYKLITLINPWAFFHKPLWRWMMPIDSTLNDSNFILGLEENAIDSLVHAVEHFIDDERTTNLKYSILHVFHAVELFLKARLAKVDADLICRKNSKEKTVYFDDLINLLDQHNVSLSEEDKKNLSELKGIRNRIEHHRIEHSRNEIEEYIGCTFYFLETFLRKELDMSLKEQLDKINDEAYKTLSMAYLFHLKRMKDSDISFHPKEAPNFHYCDNCGEMAIVVPDPRTFDSSTYCFCCFSGVWQRFVSEKDTSPKSLI